MVLSGDDRIGFVALLKDMTYKEAHSFTWGFGLSGGAVAAYGIGAAGIGLALTVGFLLLLVRAAFGRKLRVHFVAGRYGLQVPKYVVEQVRDELHWYIGGGVIGAVVLDVATLFL